MGDTFAALQRADRAIALADRAILGFDPSAQLRAARKAIATAERTAARGEALLASLSQGESA